MVQGTTTGTDYVANATRYPTADATITYDVDFDTSTMGVQPWAVTTSNSAPESGICSYYVLAGPWSNGYNHESAAGTGNNTPPTIVLVINNVDPSDPGLDDYYNGNTYYVTIKGFKYETNTKTVNSIAGGYIYKIPSGSFTIKRTDLQTEPHVGTIDTELTINPIAWTEVGVTPIV
jgi:hypothetical protein